MRKLRDLSLLTLTLGAFIFVVMGGSGMLRSLASYSDVEMSLNNTFRATYLKAPTLDSVSVAGDTVTLEWTPAASDPATIIQFWRSNDTCANSTQPSHYFFAGSTDENDGSWDDTNVPVGDHCYKLRGKLANWTSPLSNGKDVTILSPQVITVTSPSNGAQYGYHETFTAEATSDSGLDVTITIDSGSSSICHIVSGGSVTADIQMDKSTGTCTILFNQAGDSQYAPADEVEVDVTAKKATQTISVTSPLPSSTYPYDSQFTAAATADSGLTVAIGVTGGCSRIDHGNGTATVTITSPTTSCTVKFNQTGDPNYLAAAEQTVVVAVSKANQTITVTTPPPSTAAYNTAFTVAATASSGLPVAITTSGSCVGGGPGSALITMQLGTGVCNIAYNQTGNSNYNAAAQVLTVVTLPRLYPTSDKAASQGMGNKWHIGPNGVNCTTAATSCSSQIDDNYENPGPPVDYIVNGNSSSQWVEFELTDAPDDLQTLTSITVRFSAISPGSNCTLGITLYRANGTTLAPVHSEALSTSGATRSYTIGSLSLSAADVDGLYMRVENVSGNGSCEVYHINLDIDYTRIP